MPGIRRDTDKATISSVNIKLDGSSVLLKLYILMWGPGSWILHWSMDIVSYIIQLTSKSVFEEKLWITNWWNTFSACREVVFWDIMMGKSSIWNSGELRQFDIDKTKLCEPLLCFPLLATGGTFATNKSIWMTNTWQDRDIELWFCCHVTRVFSTWQL